MPEIRDATDAEIAADERATDAAADEAEDQSNAAAESLVNAEDIAAVQRADDAAAYERKLLPQEPIDVLEQLAAELRRVKDVILPAYESNERASSKVTEISKDIEDAEAALASGDAPLHEYFVSVLRAHRL